MEEEKFPSDLRRKNFRQTLDQLQNQADSILLLTHQWEDLEAHLDFSHHVVEKRAKELSSVQESVNRKLEDIRKREKELEYREKRLELREETFFSDQKKEIEERKRGIECTEKSKKELQVLIDRYDRKMVEHNKIVERFEYFSEKLEKRASEIREIEKNFFQELEKKEEELMLKEKLIEQRLKEIAVREDSLNEQSKELGFKEKQIQESMNEQIKELGFKEKQILERSERVELEKKNVMEKCEELGLKERELKERNEELEVKAIDHGNLLREIEVKKEELMMKEKQIEKDFDLNAAIEKSLNEQCKELRFKECKLKDLEFKEKQIQERAERVELENEKVMGKYRELELKEKQLQGKCKQLELKEKSIVHTHKTCVKIERLDDHAANNAMDRELNANIFIPVTLNGKALQIFLNERGVSDSMRDEVFTVLGYSSDPAKLVLDAMQGFYPPHLKKGDVEFGGSVVRRSCILLLEQLMRMSPEIRPPVRKEAMGLACVWITKLKVDTEHSLEVLGFLQLIASYGLASEFDADELLTQFEVVAHHPQAPELLRSMGFADKMSGYIKNLICKKSYVEAIAIIHASGLANDFPPEPLLKDYLQNSKIAARKLRRESKSLEGQIKAAEKRIADVNRALRCIENYNINYRPSLSSLKQSIFALEKENSIRKAKLAGCLKKPASANKVKRPKLLRKAKNLPPVVQGKGALAQVSKSASTKIPALATTSASPSPPLAQSQQQIGIKRSRTAVSTEYYRNTSSDGDQATRSLPFPAEAEQSTLQNPRCKIKKTSSSLDLQPKPKSFASDKNKEDLRQLLTMHENHDLVKEVAAALRLESDPGKLTLDVMKTSHPFNFDGERDINLIITSKSCILLLEQLRQVCPTIDPELKEEAKRFALHWDIRLKKNGKDASEVICFLQFLAAYGLASTFMGNDLLSILDADDWHKNVPGLIQVLGLADNIPSFIENLIKKGQRIEAVKYIYAFNMVDKFPLVPILKDHLSNSAKELQNINRNYVDTEMETINKELNAVRAVWNCIADYKIQGLSPETLEERITQLQKRKEEKLLAKVRTCSLSKSELQCSSVSTPTSAAPSTTQSQQQNGNKRPRIQVLSEGPPKVSLGVTPVAQPMQYQQGQPPGLVTSNVVLHNNALTRHHNWEGYPPINVPLNCYNPGVNFPYNQDTFGQPGPGHNIPKPF